MSNKAISDYSAAPTDPEVDDLFLMERDGNYYKVEHQDLGFGWAKATLVLTQAQIQAGATAVTIVAAPAAAEYIVPEECYALLDHNGTNYATATNLQVRYSGSSDILMQTSSSFVAAAADRAERLQKIFTGAANYVMTAATALVVRLDANATNNGGTISIVLIYRKVTFS